jgi:hypothetical protein
MMVGLALLSTMDTGTDRLTSGLYMAVLGIGMGCLMQLTMLIPQNSVELADIGVASSTATLTRTLGGSFGIAVLAATFNSRVADSLGEQGGGIEISETGAQLDAASLAALPDAARAAYEEAVAHGIQGVFLLAAVAAAVCFAAAWFIKEVPLRGAADPEPPAGHEAPGDTATEAPPRTAAADTVRS